MVMIKTNKKGMTLEVDAALAIMQEIYNDVAEQKNNASLIMKKMLMFLKTAEDMLTIGMVIKEQQKILNDCTEKKISLVKIHSNLLRIDKMSNKGGQGMNSLTSPTGKMELSEEESALLEQYLKGDNPDTTENNNYTI